MEIAEATPKNSEMLIELTADVVAAYVSNNPVPAAELPNLIADVLDAPHDTAVLTRVRIAVGELTARFPVYGA